MATIYNIMLYGGLALAVIFAVTASYYSLH